MKPLKVLTLGVLILPVIIIGASGGRASYPTRGGEVSWFIYPHESNPNGWYWGHDDASEEPFTYPVISSIEDISFMDITSLGTKIAPQNDFPFAYPLPDSFWYYGVWYEPGDTLYISPDGWLSFDTAAAAGFPNPPAVAIPIPSTNVPNELIAPLWQDNDPTRDPGDVSNNRVYYFYDRAAGTLVVEWYEVEGRTTGNRYTFEAMLKLGGKDLLVEEGSCGTVFSYHHIYFLYNSASAGWSADQNPPVAGIEDYAGAKGIWYQGALADGRVIRMGYKKIFQKDVIPLTFLSPGPMALRWTKIEPRFQVMNIGEETAHFPVTLDIYDSGGDRIYHYEINVYDLFPGEIRTVIAPCWEPGEINEVYTKVLHTDLNGDYCLGNDSLAEETFVHCDDTLRYLWNCSDWSKGYTIDASKSLLTCYGVDGGALITGGRAMIYPYLDTTYANPAIEIYTAVGGCGVADLASGPLIKVSSPTLQKGWNYAQFGGFGIWVPSANPGNIWVGVTSSTIGNSGLFPGVGQYVFPDPYSCYTGEGPGRSAFRVWGDFYWGGYSGDHYTVPVELFAHLGFGEFPLSPKPQFPCYDDEPHDLTCFYVEEPNVDYVEDGVTITPELAIANIGRQAEPDMGLIPVSFIAINEETADEQFHDSSLINAIGWLGDEADDPDTLIVELPDWTPEGICAETNPIVDYELIGIVRLGEVGPDESDHCPYNDTVRRSVECLLSHDMGVTDITLSPDPDVPPDHYNEGTVITITATVENFGYHAENNVEVRCEITDKTADPDTLIWHNLQNISFLDWRGNDIDNPYTIDVVFPQWTTPSENRWIIECRTELEGDDCPDDDETVLYIPDAVKDIKTLPGSFALNTYSNVVRAGCNLAFAVPKSSWVRLEVFDAGGRWVKTLYNDASEPGYHDLGWNLTDQAGRKVGAGIYLIRMEADEFKEIKKVVVLK